MLSHFGDTESILKSGKLMESQSYITKDEERMSRIASMDYYMHNRNWDILFDSVDFTKFKTVLHLYGRSGCFARAFARKYPNVEIISFDDKKWQNVQKIKVDKRGPFPSNVKLEFGNPLDKLPEVDCIIMTHDSSCLECTDSCKLGKNIHDSLRQPNGELIILDNFVSEERNIDDCGLKMSFCNLMKGKQGHVRSLTDIKLALGRLDFKDVSLCEKEFENLCCVIATKIRKQ